MMKTIRLIFRSFLRKGQNNLLKVGILGVGLAIGLILIAKVYFETSYETYITDAERIYEVHISAIKENETSKYSQLSGGTVVGIKELTPEVETATRFTWMGNPLMKTEDGKKYEYGAIIGDSCLFDLFGWNVVIGNPSEILSTPLQVMISQSKANEMGGNVIGKTLTMIDRPDLELTIAGVFEDLPINSQFNFEMIASMPTLKSISWDGSMNWLGNERYKGYVKLKPNANVANVPNGIKAMCAKYLPLEDLKKNGVEVDYTIHPLLSLHMADDGVRRMNYILGFIAFALLATTLMNYILIVISIIINKTKEIAVQKCYGAEARDIYRLAFAETGIHFGLALLLASLLLVVLRGFILNLLGVPLQELLSVNAVLLLLSIFLGLFLIAGVTVGFLYVKAPIAAAFRQYRQNRRKWKQILMFIQLTASVFLLTMLAVVTKQYDRMINDNPGYSYKNLAYTFLSGTDSLARTKIIEELYRLPEVSSVTTLSQLPFNSPSGNNVLLPGSDKELFNIADMYNVSNNYIETMGMRIVQGQSFTEGVINSREILVDEAFAKRAKDVMGWDNVIGKEIAVSEHTTYSQGPYYTICGVYENIRLNTISNQDMRPSVTFYKQEPANVLTIKFHELTPEALQQAEQTIQSLITHRDVSLYNWSLSMEYLYQNDKRFKDAVTIGSIVALLIALIGLVGYTNDEMNRRRKEVAIRKVNGGELLDVQRIFVVDMLKFALPSVVLGSIASYYLAALWLEQFSEKISLSWYLFASCSMVVVCFVIATLLYKLHSFIHENPINALKSE